MLRAAIKFGISEALSTRPGFEVWDFELAETENEGEITLLITYRYHAGCTFRATFAPEPPHGSWTSHAITVEQVPGEVQQRESFPLEGRHDLFDAIERWTGCLDEELLARRAGPLLSAQNRALSKLGEHLRALPERPIDAQKAELYRERLDRLEDAVVQLHTGDEEFADEVREEFDWLRERPDTLDERAFIHAVLVRLVRYFWDEDKLRLVEAGRMAAEEFLGGRPRGADPRAADRSGVDVPASRVQGSVEAASEG